MDLNEIQAIRGSISPKECKWLYDFVNKKVSEKALICNIGAYCGKTALIFANASPGGSVISIDPMEGHTGWNEKEQDVLSEYLKNTKPYPNISLLRMTSDKAFESLKSSMFDFIFVDGLHVYPQPKKDIENYCSLLKPGCSLLVHDVHSPHVWKSLCETIVNNPDWGNLGVYENIFFARKGGTKQYWFMLDYFYYYIKTRIWQKTQ